MTTGSVALRQARGAEPTRPHERSRALRVPRVAVGCYLVARAWQLVFLGHPIVTADTPMYRYANQRWLDFPGGNFVGHALRPWPITLLYSVAPTDTWRILAQFAIATCCWSFCIWQFGRLTSNHWAAGAAAAAVAVLALTLGVSGFDGVLLSESLTLSLVALYVGAVLSVCRGGGRLPTLVVGFVAAGLLGLLRPVLLPLVPGLALVAYVAPARPRRRRRPSAVTGITFAALSLAVIGYGWTSNVAIDKTWGDWLSVPGLNGRTLTQYYLAAYNTPSGPSLIDAMVDAGAPACIRPSPPATAPPGSRDYFKEDRLRCPQGQAWLSQHFVTALSVHLATHPGAAHRYFADALGDEGVLRTDGQPSIAIVVPDVLTSLLFSRHRGYGDPVVLLSIGSAMAIAVWWSLRRRHGHLATAAGAPASQRERKWSLVRFSPFSVSLAWVVVAAYTGLVATALLSATDASRVALPVTVLLRLALVATLTRVVMASADLATRGAVAAAESSAGAPSPVGAGAVREAGRRPRPPAPTP